LVGWAWRDKRGTRREEKKQIGGWREFVED